MVLSRLVKHLKEKEDQLPYGQVTATLKTLTDGGYKERRLILLDLVEKVLVHDKSIAIQLKEAWQGDPGGKLVVPYQFVAIGRGKGFVQEDGQVSTDLSAQRQALLKALIRGFYLRERLFSSPNMTMAKLAKEQGINGSYLMGQINLTYLSPCIITNSC